MGCDIHEYYEIRRKDVWERVELLPKLDWETVTEEEKQALYSHPANLNRNYALFSIFADVRNTFGIRPIAQARGLPADVTASVRADCEAHAQWGHNTSWLSLKELLEYDWEQIVLDDDNSTNATCREATSPFVEDTLPFLQSLVADPADLRLIFWFDN
ncbi:hypothetical protein [Deinococcus ruber]|uniref:Uncharacterized protein n=1 Tax=Deinococcus ruber TaxID=1848197 RepID=A0A918BYY3_9DEIO|nr:hypothetical protein [Deinococcus ruber]GGQ98932.1 hypothetical protein GCM10008957_09280 [Deinococcus ruber]